MISDYNKWILFSLLIFCSGVGLPQEIDNVDINKQIKNLQSQDVRIKRAAIIALGRAKFNARDAIPKLIKCLEDKNSRLVLLVIKSLQKIGIVGLPELKVALRNNKNIRIKILHVLRRLGPQIEPALPEVINLLKDSNRYVRRCALQVLETAPSQISIPELQRLLIEDEDVIREHAAKIFSLLGAKAKEAAPTLVFALQDTQASVRNFAIEALSKMGKDIIPSLQKAFINKHMREEIVKILANIEPTKQSISLCITALGDSNPVVRRYGQINLQKMGKKAVKTILTQIPHDNSSTTIYFIEILGNIGYEAKEAVPILISLSQHLNLRIVTKAKEALVRIDDVPSIFKLLQSKKLQEKTLATAILLQMDCDLFLLRALEKKYIKKQEEIEKLVQLILYKRRKKMFLSLVKNLKEDINARKYIENILLKNSSKILPIVPTLISYLDDENLQPLVINILLKIGVPAVPNLIESLKNKNKTIHQKVTWLLTEMHDYSVPYLIKALVDKEIKEKAVDILRQLKGKKILKILHAVRHISKNYSYWNKHRTSKNTILKSYDQNKNQIFSQLGTSTIISLITELKNQDFREEILNILRLPSLKFSRALIPALTEATKYNDCDVKLYTWSKIRELTGSPTPDVIQLMIKKGRLQKKLNILKKLKKNGQSSVSTLAQIFHHGDSRLKIHVLDALEEIAPEKVQKITGYNKRVLSNFQQAKKIEGYIRKKYPYSPCSSNEGKPIYYSFATTFINLNKPIFCFLVSSPCWKVIVLDRYDHTRREISIDGNCYNFLEPMTDKTAKYITGFTDITTLEIHSADTDTHMQYLQNLDKLEILKVISSGSISNIAVKHIHKLKNLKKLFLNKDVTDEQIMTLQSLPKLQILSVNSKKLTDSGLKYISNIKNLTELCLRETKITNNGIVNLQKMKLLTRLDLRGNSIDNDSMSIISRLPKLQSLRVVNTKITDEGILLLTNCIYLEKLYVSSNISKNTISKLRESLKKCEVFIRK